MKFLCGLDEAGRGPLAGPVFAGAVILDPNKPIEGLNDSKKLSAKKRAILEAQIKDRALYWAVASASVEEIDQMNILWASMLAMERAGMGALDAFQEVEFRVDGNRVPKAFQEVGCAVVGGDALERCIMAASILAKEARDRLLRDYECRYPQYGFGNHKGYPTKEHLLAIQMHGILSVHRKTFGPVKNLGATQKKKQKPMK